MAIKLEAAPRYHCCDNATLNRVAQLHTLITLQNRSMHIEYPSILPDAPDAANFR
jgi:hypothetical protein